MVASLARSQGRTLGQLAQAQKQADPCLLDLEQVEIEKTAESWLPSISAVAETQDRPSTTNTGSGPDYVRGWRQVESRRRTVISIRVEEAAASSSQIKVLAHLQDNGQVAAQLRDVTREVVSLSIEPT
jgi:hypothetical protein